MTNRVRALVLGVTAVGAAALTLTAMNDGGADTPPVSSATTCAGTPVSLSPILKSASVETLNVLKTRVAAKAATPTEASVSGYFLSADPKNFVATAVDASVVASGGLMPTRVDTDTLGPVTVVVSYGKWSGQQFRNAPAPVPVDDQGQTWPTLPDINVQVAYFSAASGEYLGSDAFPGGCVLG